MNVVTRFAPSPTGYFHSGSYRTALFAWIFARQNKGKFILRIEDTDKERSKKEYEDNIVESLAWLGLNYDEFYRQSDRTDLYRTNIKKLMDSGHAYLSKESPGDTAQAEGKTNREEVIRFKNPNKRVTFTDLIRGPIEFNTTELGDFVIAKSLDEPVFHLAVVSDDADSGVTHVIRGEDHISNTPRHILLYEALGSPVPHYAHIPIVLGADRSKLSKRKGAVPVSEYRTRGYLPEALINYLALLGWHPADDQEILSLDDIVKGFSLDRVQKSGAIFDEEKLKWFNRQYILKLSDASFADHARPFLPEWLLLDDRLFARLISLLKEKISAFGEIPDMFSAAAKGELAFIKALPDYDPRSLLWKKNPDPIAAQKHLAEARKLIEAIPGGASAPSPLFTAETLKAALWPYAEANGKGDVLWPLRVALTGQDKSPDPFVSAAALGREESLKRIDKALAGLSTMP